MEHRTQIQTRKDIFIHSLHSCCHVWFCPKEEHKSTISRTETSVQCMQQLIIHKHLNKRAET